MIKFLSLEGLQLQARQKKIQTSGTKEELLERLEFFDRVAHLVSAELELLATELGFKLKSTTAPTKRTELVRKIFKKSNKPGAPSIADRVSVAKTWLGRTVRPDANPSAHADRLKPDAVDVKPMARSAEEIAALEEQTRIDAETIRVLMEKVAFLEAQLAATKT